MPYPVHLKQATALVDSIPTCASIYAFSDKIMVTITQDDRLAQWFQVPMDSLSPSQRDTYLPNGMSNPDIDDAADGDTHDNDQDDSSLLPLSHLTARTLLGASTPEREAMGQLFAVQIASAIALRDPGETRAVLLGLGLRPVAAGSQDQGPSREMFFDLMDLIVRCLRLIGG